MLKIDTLGIRH